MRYAILHVPRAGRVTERRGSTDHEVKRVSRVLSKDQLHATKVKATMPLIAPRAVCRLSHGSIRIVGF